MQKIPNRRGMNKPPYCVLSSATRHHGTETLFKNPCLPEVWNTCQYMWAENKHYWLAFNHLFPLQEHLMSPKVQNYLQCQYYMKWKQLCANSDALTVTKIRYEIKKRVFKLAWIPHACQDKIWSTKHINGFEQYPFDADVNASAPRILMKRDPEW